MIGLLTSLALGGGFVLFGFEVGRRYERTPELQPRSHRSNLRLIPHAYDWANE